MPHSERATPEPEPLPYWLVNIPKEQWPATCPDYLRDISPRNQQLLAVSDDKITRVGWERVKEVVFEGDINQFRRPAAELRKYLKYSHWLRAEYGTIANFMLSQRLKWTDIAPRGGPFEYAEDYRILRNDWPYALETQIVHLVCWVKFELAEDPATHRSTPQAEQQIDDFVTRTFRNRMPAGSVIWFKNYKALKSVHEIEHFHILLNDPPADFLQEVTTGDVPMVDKVQ